jgi:hypothetical protein
MSSMPESKRLVRFVFSKAADYRLIPATGVFGGPTPSGQIKMSFMVDHGTEPDSVVHAMTADGTLGEEVDREPKTKTITRELQVGIVLDLGTAEIIAKWLQENVAAVRKAMKGS